MSFGTQEKMSMASSVRRREWAAWPPPRSPRGPWAGAPTAGRRHGCLLSNGAFTTLANAPGAFLESIAQGLDDRGRIAGFLF